MVGLTAVIEEAGGIISYWSTAFAPGKSAVHYAGRVFDDAEIRALVRSSLDFWLTAGPEAARRVAAPRGE